MAERGGAVVPPGQLLLATGNRGKLLELRAMLPGIATTGLDELGPMDLDEPGQDYATNARAKACAAAASTGMPALADDSGLEVDALGGAPGWRSARFGGGHGDDRANRERLLEVMREVPPGQRRARFRCAVAFADPRGPLGPRVLLAFGECEGAIALAPRGHGGFGYDPILELRGHTGTMAELDEITKNAVSHRARAVAVLLPALRAYLSARHASLTPIVRGVPRVS